MKWKNQKLKIALLTFSILTSFFALAPNNIVCAEQPEAKKLSGIESIVPTGDGSATDLTIKLTSPATYTSYKTTSPLRLVIDFSQVTQGNISAPVVINNGNFKTVTVSRFDTEAGVLTRVAIELEVDSEAVISTLPANPGELKISFPDLVKAASSAVKKDLSDTPAVVKEPAHLTSAPSLSDDVSFKTLTAITVKNREIILALDGVVSDFKTFRLNKPERYVVDLMNVKSGLPTRLLPLNASGVASARIGLYPDKLRIVLDAVNGSFPEATAVKKDNLIIITLEQRTGNENTKLTATHAENNNTSKPVTAAVSVPPEVKPLTKPEISKPVVSAVQIPKTTGKSFPLSGVPSIEMIDFQVVENISRLSVKVSGVVTVEQPLKTPGYVTLTIKNSTLPRNMQRSLEAGSFISPVLRITPLSIKTKKGTDTKIRIATRVSAPFELRQEGDMIFVDFKHPEGLSGDKLFTESIDSKKPAVAKKAVNNAEEEMSSDLSPASESVTGKSVDVTRAFRGRKVTLEFADADVRKIFQLLSEVSGKNFILGDDVTGNISLKLVNVPWDQALYIILDTKELESRESGNVLTIKKKGKFKSALDEELETKKALAKGIELKTETFSINYADVDAISSQFNGLKTDRGVISSDKRTGSVIVKDVPLALDDMRRLLKQLDVPERQVMIEARIVEATSTFTRSLGVNWGVHQRDGSASFLGINQMDTSFGGIANAAAATSGVSGQPGVAMGLSFGKLTSNIAIDMRLNAAASGGLIKIISSPKVATLNHKTAKIAQGQSIPYQNTTATTGAVTAFVSAALSLEVTPHINANGTIVMKIDAKNDAPGTGSPPAINSKQATTELLLRDGETTVIGGIFVDSEQDGTEGIPYLMDIPFIGSLFSSSSKSKIKTELLIFITPRILSGI